ncbi:sensor histidine kinase [Paramicrobacterium fandaimingii]|uniref:sensor histidine kinase n=1 Tax=Paramicrobacterium fandaimingii TaxID=2708079 RepID=UPI00141E01BD|nr:histidine kinase [Microbacterium fandaimingii]
MRTTLERMIRALLPRQYAIDGAVGALVALLCLPFALRGNFIEPWVVLVVWGSLSLRRASPGIALTISWVAVIAQMAFGASANAYNVAIPIILYATARYGDGWVRWYGLISAVVGGLVASAYTVLVTNTGVTANAEALPILVFATVAGATAGVVVLGLSWTLGQLMRTADAARQAGYERFRARQAQSLAERATVVEQERGRIARDMHDVVAHSLAVVVAQADGARYVHKGDADALARTLETVSDTARHALGDVRLLLSELRHEQEAGPQPGFADIDTLVETMRSAGLMVSYTLVGTLPDLPTGRQIAAYRIMQEALTNAMHHGEPHRDVEVTVVGSDAGVELIVQNVVGQSAPSRGTDLSRGHGLPGMRERATLAGGTLDIDASTPGWFRVIARLPIA